MSRFQEKLEKMPDWRPFAPSTTSTVRCADGLHRRRSDCVLDPAVGWVRREDDDNPALDERSSRTYPRPVNREAPATLETSGGVTGKEV